MFPSCSKAVDFTARLGPVAPQRCRNNIGTTESFHNGWRPRLGLSVKAGLDKEHWTRVKALSRRLATGIADEYDTLRPVADLKQQLQQRLYVLLQNPVEWKGPEPSDDDKQHIYDSIAEDLSRRLIDLASRRVRTGRQGEWRTAFDEAGTGSTFRRARLIAEGIYERAAPVPDVTPSPDRNAFLEDVASATRTAVESAGATLRQGNARVFPRRTRNPTTTMWFRVQDGASLTPSAPASAILKDLLARADQRRWNLALGSDPHAQALAVAPLCERRPLLSVIGLEPCVRQRHTHPRCVPGARGHRQGG